MKLFKTLATLFCLVALCAFVAPTATADDWNRKTVITFSGPVEVPGVGQHNLPAGTYVFKILDSQSDRHIVQIFNQDESQVLTTILAIPNYRLKTTDKTTITFRERPAGEPEALRAWFYPGRAWGEEFVYARPRAIELAKETNEPVLATSIEETAPVETLKTAPVEAVAPTGEPVELARVVEPPPAADPVAAIQPAADSLPQTASSLPMIALFGLMMIGAGLAISAFSKRALRVEPIEPMEKQ
jgi:LPXTG-motif cell wall-anchored protein